MSAAHHGRALQRTTGARRPRLQIVLCVASGCQGHHGLSPGPPGPRNVRERGVHIARVPGGRVAGVG
eukprot:1100336-Lingulodinium_polyedra.AAC.1